MSHPHLPLRAAAIVYAACYFVALFLPRLPEGAFSDDQVSTLFGDPAERTPIIIGGYALSAAAVAFLVFISLLMRALNPGRAASTGLVRVAGTTYAAMLMLAAVLFCSLPMGVAIGELPTDTDPTVYRAMSNAGFYALLVPGLLAAAVVLVAFSWELRRRREVSGWAPVLGFVLAPLLLLGFAWVPQFLVPIWAVAVAHAPFRMAPVRETVPLS